MTALTRRVALCLAALFMMAGCTTCGGNGPQADPPPAPPPLPPSPPSLTRPQFDRNLAFAALEAQCDFGPRNPGSAGHAACGDWLQAQLEALAGAEHVHVQPFVSRTPMGGPFNFRNFLAIFGADKPGDPLLLGAHWDTRPIADEDPDPRNRNTPILGANDGASGVAVLLELGRLLKERPAPFPVMIAFFDAEDSGMSGVRDFPYSGYCIGSNYMAGNWPAGFPHPARMILLDIVGTDERRNPRLQGEGEIGGPEFKLEGYSLGSAPGLVNEIWTAAERLGHGAFRRVAGGHIIDDHLPFIERGIPAVNIIHFRPAEWHTVDDTPEHCSPDTLFQVGDTLVEVIWGR